MSRSPLVVSRQEVKTRLDEIHARLRTVLTERLDEALSAVNADGLIGLRDTGKDGMTMSHLPQICADHAPGGPVIDLDARHGLIPLARVDDWHRCRLGQFNMPVSQAD